MASGDRPVSAWRDRTSTACLVGVLLFGVLTGPLLYLSNVVADEDAFVAVTDEVLAQPDVRRFVAAEAATVAFESAEADELVAEVLPEQARSLSVPVTRIAAEQLTNAAFELLDTEAGTNARDAALRQLHQEVTGDGETVVIDLRAVLVRTARELAGPTIGAAAAKAVGGTDIGRFVLVEPGSSTAGLLEIVRIIPGLGLVAALAFLVLIVAAVVVANDRRRALTRVGLAMAASALLATVVVSTVLAVLLTPSGEVGAAIAEVIGGDFADQQQGTIVTGGILALVGLLLGPRPAAVALRRLPGDLWRRDEQLPTTVARIVGDNPPLARLVVWAVSVAVLLSWTRPTLRVVITVIVVTLAAQAMIWAWTDGGQRAAALRTTLGLPKPMVGTAGPGAETVDAHRRTRSNLAILAIVLAVFWPAFSTLVLSRLFIAAGLAQIAVEARPARQRAIAASAADLAEGSEARSDEAESLPRRWLVPAGLATVAAVAAGLALTIGSTESSAAATGCNGHAELCERRIDEVVFAGSHNAMSSNDLGWDLAMQDGDMVTQLEHGVRALLIDALYWDATGTVEGGDDPAAAAVIEAALSDDVPKPGTWLCHGFCALGATDLTAGLAGVNSWLDANPREVLLIIVQDEIDPEDLEAAFADSGLLAKVHIHDPAGDGPWPTLGELIEADERILVWAENGGAPGAWIQNGYADTFTETPFTFALRSDFSCAPNRGGEDNPLFLINHWLTTGIPVREAAEAINGRDALLDRVLTCEAERGQQPTILAVDFVETGDLIDVVDELNGVG